MAEYLDKEAFKKSVEERYCKPCKAEKKDHNGCCCRACWVDDMLDEVECFQPADVAPVVHGRWVTHYRSGTPVAEGYVSTCCDMWNNRKSDNCPSCGAKMDGGDSNAADCRG